MIPAVAVFSHDLVAQRVHELGPDKEKRKAFASDAAGAASAVAASGLLQAVLLWSGRGGEDTRFIAAVGDWLASDNNPRQLWRGRQAGDRLVDWLLGRDPGEYLVATGTAIELLVYVKRFANLAKLDPAWPVAV